MKAITIIKTDKGYAAIRTDSASLPPHNIVSLLCFGDLDDSLSYRHDGVISSVREFFKDEPEPQK